MKATWIALALAALLSPLATQAETLIAVAAQQVTDWKAVYGRIEARDRIAARARLGGTLVDLAVSEGDSVAAGQVLGRIVDEKLDFQIGAVDAQLAALGAQLENAQTELARGEELLARGVTTAQRLDALRTQVDVIEGQIAAQRATRQVLQQQAADGIVLAPVAGRVLDVPVARGAVVMPGEALAQIGGGGFFLRIAVPERHAHALREGDAIRLGTVGGTEGATLAKVYPQIENGRVVADVEVPGLDAAFVDARVLVRLPLGERQAYLLPESAVQTRSGLDFVTVALAGGERAERAVVLGDRLVQDGVAMVEVLTGLAGGETVVTHD